MLWQNATSTHLDPLARRLTVRDGKVAGRVAFTGIRAVARLFSGDALTRRASSGGYKRFPCIQGAHAPHGSSSSSFGRAKGVAIGSRCVLVTGPAVFIGPQIGRAAGGLKKRGRAR